MKIDVMRKYIIDNSVNYESNEHQENLALLWRNFETTNEDHLFNDEDIESISFYNGWYWCRYDIDMI
jgi:hypothetical protein